MSPADSLAVFEAGWHVGLDAGMLRVGCVAIIAMVLAFMAGQENCRHVYPPTKENEKKT